MNRGAARTTVFHDNTSRKLFLKCLGAAMPRNQIEVHGYCLMGNHYHLLLHSLGGNLSKAMQLLVGRFTHRTNICNGLDGPIFRGRFHSAAIDSDAHLLQALRYIHVNPVEAHLAPTAEAWPWSSAQFYAGTRHPAPSWLTTATLLGFFGDDTRLSGYRDFLSAGIDDVTRRRYDKMD